MILWARTRRTGRLGAVLVGVVAVGHLIGDQVLAVPVLVGTGGSLLLTTLLPLVWSAVVADAFAARGLSLEGRPVHVPGRRRSRLGLLDASLFTGAVAFAAAAFSWIAVTGPGSTGIGPVLILSAVAVIGTIWFGSAQGVLAASTLTVLTTVYGMTAPGADLVRVLQADGNQVWQVGWGVVLCGCAAWLLLTDRVVTRLGVTERLG